jgi:hypothetical protein
MNKQNVSKDTERSIYIEPSVEIIGIEVEANILSISLKSSYTSDFEAGGVVGGSRMTSRGTKLSDFEAGGNAGFSR